MTRKTHLIAGATALFAGLALPVAAQDQLMPVDGAELSYTDQGAGRPILFLHGAISDARVWSRYAPIISEDYRFIAYTQRYFGTNSWPDDGQKFSRQTHIADLIAFVEGLGAGPVDLVTWSYSGEIGTYAALQRPDLFRSMMHYEPSVDALLAELPGAGAAQKQFISKLGPAVEALDNGAVEDAALRFIEAVFRMPEGSAANEPEPYPGYWRANGRTLPKFVSMSPAAPLSCDDLGALSVPTLVVVGSKALVQDAMVGERLADCLGNALLLPMPDANHGGPYQQPEHFLE